VIGKRLGQYEIVEQLGVGGMGEVYVAEDSRLGRRIALKLLPASMAADPERRMRFEREARAVAKLSHPNIVTLYSVEEIDGLHFFTMELVDGTTLADVLSDRQQGLAPVELARLAAQLVEAVATAHRAGVTHRDLKPANVMVTAEGRVKVLDFGLAKLAETTAGNDDRTVVLSDQKTEVGQVVGTLAYMSPEQAEGKPVDERSDVFALGILLHRMATGDSPFTGDTRISLVASILKDTPPKISDIRPQLGPAFSDIVSRCLEKSPDRRYPSAAELLVDLEQVRKALETSELLSGISGIGTVASPRSSRGTIWRIAVGVGAAAVLGVVALVALRNSGEPEAAAAAANARNSVAVFYFQNITGDPEIEWLRTGLTDMLVTDLSQSPDLRVVGTDRLYQILSDLGREADQQLSSDVIQEVARKTDVGTAVLGSYVKAGDTLRINVRVQDIAGGTVLASEKVEGSGDQAVFTMVDELTRRIRKKLALADLQEGTADRNLATVTTESVAAYRAYVEAIRHHELGDEQSAIPRLEEAIELDPEFAMALAKLSVAYGNSNEPDKSSEYGERALELVDRLTARERYYIEGLYYSKDSETIDRAVEAYRKAVELFPDHTSARNNLAQLYLRQERYDEAIVHLESLRRDGMTFPGTYSSLANAYLATERPDEAVEALEAYAADHPDSSVSYSNLGQLQLRTDRIDDALRNLQRAEELAPGSVTDDLFAVYVLSGRWDDAREAAIRIQSGPVEPMRWVGFLMEGLVSFYNGHADAGIGRMRAGIDVAPEGASALEVRKVDVAFTVRLGRDAEALERLSPLLETAPTPDDIRALQSAAAIACTRLGRLDEADAHLALALAASEGELNEGVRHIFRGVLALERGDADSAIRELLAADPLLPAIAQQSLDHADVWSGLGRAHLMRGEAAEAAVWFRKLIDSGATRLITPLAFVRSHYFLGRCYDETGDPEQAREYYEKFVEYWGDGDLDRERVEEARARLAG
jgi:serine/threonine protein kinase/tetratricopeptide (TPR) repeat protein